MAQRCYGPRDTRIRWHLGNQHCYGTPWYPGKPPGPETRRALGIRVRVWRPKEEEKQLCPSRCLQNCCSCSVATPSGEGASGSFHLQHHKWVDRRRRSVVSDFARNWVLNIFLWKKFLWVSSAGVRNQDSLSTICWYVTEKFVIASGGWSSRSSRRSAAAVRRSREEEEERREVESMAVQS